MVNPLSFLPPFLFFGVTSDTYNKQVNDITMKLPLLFGTVKEL